METATATETYFMIRNAETKAFIKNDGSLISKREFTMRIDESFVYEINKDSPERRLMYWKAVYKGVALELFIF